MAMSSIHTLYASSFRLCFPNSSPQFKPLNAIPLRGTKHDNNNNKNNVKFFRERTGTRATLDDVETDKLSTIPLVENEKAKKDVEESVKVLKDAAKTRKVAAEESLSALSIIEKAKVDPSAFFETLGGKEPPGGPIC